MNITWVTCLGLCVVHGRLNSVSDLYDIYTIDYLTLFVLIQLLNMSVRVICHRAWDLI